MHFEIDKDNLITGFHIESWDRKSLGFRLIRKVKKYKNKDWKDFILFVLKNKLFLKLRILFLLDDKETIYFWGCAPIYGERDKESIETLFEITSGKMRIKYAKFYLKSFGDEKLELTSVLYETGLARMFEENDRGSEDIVFKLKVNEIKKISFGFNISRNNENSLYILVDKYDGKERLMKAKVKDTMYVAIKGKNGELDILTEKYLENTPVNKLKIYIAFIATHTRNKQKQNKATEILKKISKVHKKEYEFHEKKATKNNQHLLFSEDNQEMKNNSKIS